VTKLAVHPFGHPFGQLAVGRKVVNEFCGPGSLTNYTDKSFLLMVCLLLLFELEQGGEAVVSPGADPPTAENSGCNTRWFFLS
jgi:hypothetical protein